MNDNNEHEILMLIRQLAAGANLTPFEENKVNILMFSKRALLMQDLDELINTQIVAEQEMQDALQRGDKYMVDILGDQLIDIDSLYVQMSTAMEARGISA